MEHRDRRHELTVDEANAVVWALGPDHNGVADRTMVGGHRNRSHRHLLLSALHEVNDAAGWVSPASVDAIARRLAISPAEVYGVATFYDLFALEPRPARHLRACVDLACRTADPARCGELPAGVEPSACLGMCERAPAALLATPDSGRLAIEATALDGLDPAQDPPPESPPEVAVPQRGDESLVLLRRVGRHDPLDLDAYLADGGFTALDTARSIGSEATIDAIDASGLVGRGGAGFPTARKWSAVAQQPATPRYLVCNADESEPGTFKDRVLIENDPYCLIESIAIAAGAIGADTAYVYLRGEYPRAAATLAEAMRRVRADPRTLDRLAELTITVVRGAGAYICGEETAIFSSIEGFRGEPRNKPPFPFEVGLFGKPTAVNNVETLMNVVPIIRQATADGPAFTADRRLFCVSGAVARPGVYEATLGLTLGDLIETAGGLREGAELAAVLLGGAAGGFAGPDDLDLVLDTDSLRQAGLTLGSGVVMVLDASVDLVDFVVRIAEFFRHESCGQCVPCRVGTVRQHEALQALATATSADDRRQLGALIDDINRAMTDASICGLGQTAGSAVAVAINNLGVFDER